MTAPEPAMSLYVSEPLTSSQAQYPLAHRSTIGYLDQALHAMTIWSRCTPIQREVLRAVYPVVRDAVASGEPGQEVELPSLTGNPRTLRVLERRGLAAKGQLTPLGGLVVWWCAKPKEQT